MKNFKNEFHGIYQNVRNCNNFIQSLEIELTASQLDEFKEICATFNIDKIKKYVAKIREQPIEDMSVRQLRNVAKNLGIGYYTVLSKHALLREILNVSTRHQESA